MLLHASNIETTTDYHTWVGRSNYLEKKKKYSLEKIPEKKSLVFYPGTKHRWCKDEYINIVLKRK